MPIGGPGIGGGAASGAAAGSAFGPWGTAIGAGIGAIGGLLGRPRLPKWYEQEMKYWLQEAQRAHGQARADYGGPGGSRERAFGLYDEILAQPGYSEEEAAGMYFTPEELAKMRYTPEEMEALRISPEEEAGIISTTLDPIAGTLQNARDALTRASAARGGYGGGYGANIQRVQEEGGRQAAEAARNARLGIAEMRRTGEQRIADVRRGVGELGATQRTGTLRDIGLTRLRGREFGTQGRERLAEADLQRMLAYFQKFDAPPGEQGIGGRIAGGASAGGLYGMRYG